MKRWITKMYSYLICLLLLLQHVNSANTIIYGLEQEVKRSEFPDGFLFGTSTSAYQIEGAYTEDGRSLSNWDAYCSINGRIPNGGSGNIADDHYHRYLEDIDTMASLGANAYRFSISWRGKFWPVNPVGIKFYNNIIDSLLLKGITPFVTIHHYDYPQEFEDRFGAWLSPLMQEEFVHFDETCFKSFGDRVKYWATMNEPNLYMEMAYLKGVFPPSHCSTPFGECSSGNSDIEPLLAVHNSILAHAKAVNLYRHQFQAKPGGMIGIVASAYMYKPMTDNEADRKAANRALAFHVAWLLDPLVHGDYPIEMRQYHGRKLPRFSSEEAILIKNSTDFIGLNHYTTCFAKDCLHSNCACMDSDVLCTHGENRAIRGFVLVTGQKNGAYIGDQMGMPGSYVVPQGMEEIVDYVKKRYNNMPIFVTENGYASNENKEEGYDLDQDMKRIKYHKAYLASLARSIRNGADVRGYFIWSLMDNFEWRFGYTVKFGLYHVDPLTLDRSPKLSAQWYRDFLTNSSLNNIQAKSST
ncbi:beta-glucosidase 18-like isoform X2 [Lycium ferocissimum]|uniref:beta-glucosidase 18-like isoform X2 n=1 Tax=Lycium ferocissimum TaxID=112874 RepID=UPI0028166570|nr:beta-glucosidase 18-like isoform X2 [Lycium ferocissimum]